MNTYDVLFSVMHKWNGKFRVLEFTLFPNVTKQFHLLSQSVKMFGCHQMIWCALLGLCLQWLLLTLHVDESLIYTIVCQMRILYRGSCREPIQRHHNVCKEGNQKKIRFFVHFDAYFEQLNELDRTKNLFLSGQTLAHPLVPTLTPLPPHPSILEEPYKVNLYNVNGDWEKTLSILGKCWVGCS